LSYLCVAEIARGGGHDKCVARRDASSVCVGIEKIVNFSDALNPPAQSPPETTTEAEPPTDKTAQNESGPPKTVLEFMRRSTDASGDQLKKAGAAVKGTGEAIGGAVKKSWHCLASMFKEC
jgi:hypothetical protein